MSEFTYTYSKSVDFGGQLAPGQFATEVANSSIGTNFLRVDTLGDDVYVIFSVALTAPQQVTLDGLVAAHVPDPVNAITSTAGYIELTSTLADAAAIVINASNAAGGIDIDAGTGGIAIDTTNGININAGAAIAISNTAGNITLDTPALLDLNAVSGINIGNDPDASPVNIGTSSSARTITIGNSTGATAVDINTGTGGVSLNSVSTDADSIRINTSGGIDVDATGDINMATGSAAGGAITLDAAFNNGGVSIASGSQGIAINSGTGLIGIGHWSAGDIQVGTSATARTITLGNSTGATALVLNSGTGDIALNSQDAVAIDTIGACTIDAGGVLELNSDGGAISIGNDANNFNMNIGTAGSRVINIGNTNASSAVNIISGTFGATFGNDASSGEIQIAASANAKTVRVGNATGGSALVLNAGTGAMTLDSVAAVEINSSAGQINIGNDSVNQNINIAGAGSRVVTIGNTNASSAVNILSGSFGLTVGNDASGGEIQIAASANAKTVKIGNGTGGSRLFERWGTGGRILHQAAETSLSNSSQTLTIAQLLGDILTITPTTDRTLTLPTAADAVAGISGVQVNDAIDFRIINLQASASDPEAILAMGTGGTAVGYMNVPPHVNNAGTYFYSGTGIFRMRFTNVTVSSEAYTVYRIG